jgi:hypothetical protein
VKPTFGRWRHGWDDALPESEARVDTSRPARGPLLLISGRGHSLIIESGWREVAEIALAFVEKHAAK